MERAALESRVAADPDEAADLERLRATLGMLDADAETGPSPTGLAERTLARLVALTQA